MLDIFSCAYLSFQCFVGEMSVYVFCPLYKWVAYIFILGF